MKIQRDELVRASILEAARRVFRKWGLNKATMEDIAQEAGKGKSTLYNYFDSKEEVFETLAMVELEKILNMAKAASEAAPSVKEKFRIYLTTRLVELRQAVGVHPLVTGEMKSKKEFVAKMLRQMSKHEEKVLLGILEQGMKSGEFRYLNEHNLHKAASVIVGLVRGMDSYLFLENDDKEKLDIAVAMISNGI
jgi:AcrR family transcriptional regulator